MRDKGLGLADQFHFQFRQEDGVELQAFRFVNCHDSHVGRQRIGDLGGAHVFDEMSSAQASHRLIANRRVDQLLQTVCVTTTTEGQ